MSAVRLLPMAMLAWRSCGFHNSMRAAVPSASAWSSSCFTCPSSLASFLWKTSTSRCSLSPRFARGLFTSAQAAGGSKTISLSSSSSVSQASDASVLPAGDWKLVKSVGDGSCFFHSVSSCMQGKYGPTELRRAACELVEVKAEEEINGATVAQWIEWETGMTPEAYKEMMARDGAWGGAIELHLLADFLSSKIKVYQRSANGDYILQHVFGGASSSSSSSFHLLYDGSHYDALVPARMQSAGGEGASTSKERAIDRLLLSDPAKLKSQIAVRNKFGQCVVGYPEPKGEQHSATVIFMHGLGDSGYGWAPVSEQLNMPWIKFLFPTAPAQPVKEERR
eukprot:749767-Hanusia_phi.AAC.6